MYAVFRAKSIFHICLLLLTISACAPQGRGTEYCLIGKPIFISKRDVLTDQTARQILEHDETGKVLCGWRG